MTKTIANTAMVAVVYVILTLGFGFMSYGPVQFRIAEILTLMVFYNKKHFTGLVLGCAIANAFSPLGFVDVAIGTFATVLALLYIMAIRKYLGDSLKSLVIASFGPTVFNAILVGLELTILFKEMPFLLNATYVAIGELVVVSILGVVIIPKIKKFI